MSPCQPQCLSASRDTVNCLLFGTAEVPMPSYVPFQSMMSVNSIEPGLLESARACRTLNSLFFYP
eukprot:scaffold34991_cov25-Prasinocladus_malaysianus.AAC.1